MAQLTPELVDVFRRLDTCSVSNAVETFDCRLRNEGFTDGTVRCIFENRPPVVGHAVTARIHGSSPPAVGPGYYDRTDWWTYILTVPPPRIVVVEDADEHPGVGAFVGEVHANILSALGCVAYVTNGSVRDVPHVAPTGFQLYASHVAVSHAYVHIVEFGQPVTVAGLDVTTGDVLFGDGHGLLTIPESIVAQVPAAAERMLAAERDVIALCQSPSFSLEQLRVAVRQLP
jgi:4-hydroxy-4-methyl-2-oxoglutarate aldolase